MKDAACVYEQIESPVIFLHLFRHFCDLTLFGHVQALDTDVQVAEFFSIKSSVFA